jgi:hypothetical protein
LCAPSGYILCRSGDCLAHPCNRPERPGDPLNLPRRRASYTSNGPRATRKRFATGSKKFDGCPVGHCRRRIIR